MRDRQIEIDRARGQEERIECQRNKQKFREFLKINNFQETSRYLFRLAPSMCVGLYVCVCGKTLRIELMFHPHVLYEIVRVHSVCLRLLSIVYLPAISFQLVFALSQLPRTEGEDIHTHTHLHTHTHTHIHK